MTERRRPGAGAAKPPLIADEDAELWRQVSATVKPLRRRRVPGPAPETPGAAIDKKPTPAPDRPKPKAIRNPASPHPPSAPAARPELTGIDRRMRQKLSRGQVEVDARLDLHGSSRAMARGRLLDFLMRARGLGHRTVLVITGKGEAPFARHTLHGTEHFHAPERQGVLRQAVTEWFGQADFTAVVSGFQPAHPKHGGGGAFYVRLRRPQTSRRPK